ncbi:MAG: hypothetical protein Q4F95_06750 [Oscillospiraceae bacterium]|nr:hypothetical protein [Oscillospiraceae bacterium]
MKESIFKKQLNDIIREYINETKIPFARNKEFQGLPELRKKYAPAIENDVNMASKKAIDKSEKAYNDYLSRLDDAYMITGERINTADLALLNPDVFKMTQDEFNDVAFRNKDNPTMFVALRSYAKELNLMCPENIIGKKEKAERAKHAYHTALNYINRSSGDFCCNDYMLTMVGDLFNEATLLCE